MKTILRERVPNHKKIPRIYKNEFESKLRKYYDKLEILKKKKKLTIK